ncbi:magnesium chelatase [Rhodocaloribacter litoris]|uniref:magnesium chelatase n=1 Tax=Rhodocaloribacter litoris TaxID=2558931 RepID=UPI00141D7C27|nr:magnesium chelatase [Rhodocaloribacter litoris]QXD17059.1 magnesium chelatase [Rhodocaloribacter litoris]
MSTQQHTQSLTSIRTLGELKASGYRVLSVKDELRKNLIARLQCGEEVFPGILGFDRTVIPQIQNAILGRHDFILLGLRGQAKSRIIRMIPSLLDEYIPVVAGSELNDNPFAPISKYARDLVAERGDETPIAWLHRSKRYGEKLATPDTTIADLIGDIDPIKAAHHRLTYADEEVIHFGIIPRTNRGIFAINELPDLQPRIQVGLLNIMEEQDIQIRGFNVRFPLDVLMIFTANPEDYTNRGNIITPLKDRIDSQIITHYPKDLETGIAITRQEAWEARDGLAPRVHVPHYFREIIEQIAFEARQSEYVDQKSGVSVRMTRAALEDLISAAERRALLAGEAETTARISDLIHVEPAVTGKIELVYEGEQEGAQNVARLLIGRAVKAIFPRYFPDPSDKRTGRAPYEKVLAWFAGGRHVTLRPDMPFADYAKALDAVDGLREVVRRFTDPKTPAETASAMEFVLEALHQNSLIGKDLLESEQTYSDIMGSMLSSLGNLDDDDEDDDGFDDEDDFYRRYR